MKRTQPKRRAHMPCTALWISSLVAICWLTAPASARQPAQQESPQKDASTPAESIATGKGAKTQEGEPGATESPATQPAAPSKPKPGPKYHYLRFQDDFSYLDGEPGSYTPDFFDPIKNIRLGPDWRLSLGGEFRVRVESETNKAFGATEPANDTFQHYRFFFHADLRYRKLFRVFAQGVEVFDEDRDLARRAIDENQWDLQQLFFDLRFLGEESPWTLRLGRQELNYGNERLISPLEWASTRRRFDAVKLFAKTEALDIDFFYAKPVIVQRRQSDRLDEQFDFYGVYTTYKGLPRHGLDLYLLGVHDIRNIRNPNGRRGDRTTFTLGTRFWGKTAGFDYETELAGQWGHWAGDTVQAWALAVDAGYTFDHMMKPRLGFGFDWATGDKSPRDRSVQTFDQLFPLGHKYFGFLDLVGRKNIIAPNVNLSLWPVPKKIRFAAAWHWFRLAEEHDALYNAGGGATRRDPTGRSGREIGNELDLTLLWKIDVHSAMLFGWSHLWDADFIQSTGPSENADLFYVQYAFKF